MHEMALTRDVVDMVIQEAEKVQAAKVVVVHLTVGYVRDIVEELFEKCFAYMARGTVAEGAEIVLTRIPFTVRCNSCGQVYHINVRDSSTWTCPGCQAREYQLNSGMEFFINTIEVVHADSFKTEVNASMGHSGF